MALLGVQCRKTPLGNGHPSKGGRMQSLKSIDPESHAFAWRRGSDGAELVKKDLAAAAMAPPHLVAKGEKSAPLAEGLCSSTPAR